MPSQKLEILEKNGHGLTVLKMNPNRSSEQLMNSQSSEEQSSEDSCSTGPSIRDVKVSEWIIMFILCFVNLINYMDRFTLAGVLDDIQAHYDIKNDKAGLLQTSFIISYMIFAPLFGYLGDRYSRKWIMAIGVALWSATTLAGSFMNNFTWFMVFRAMVGIGEASYSTIAPTIISDLFVKSVRSKMLAFFYFAIPVGSGLGYIVGSETARLMGSWQWALRVTPGLGLIAVLLILLVLRDPERGQSEGSGHMEATSWKEDLVDLSKNKSFILSTAGFTCVAFVAGALAWWGPKFIYLGIRLQPGKEDVKLADVSFKFGLIAMLSGLIGVPTGSFISQRLKPTYEQVDPLICAYGLMLSAPCIFIALVVCTSNSTFCYIFVFLGEFFINLTWSIVADMLLYCVLPTRRSTAEGFQLLASHALGDAGSPYLIGLISEMIGGALGVTASISSANGISNSTVTPEPDPAASWNEFRSLQYAIFITCFIEVLGGILFIVNSLYIVEDKRKVDDAVKNAAIRSTNVVSNDGVTLDEDFSCSL